MKKKIFALLSLSLLLTGCGNIPTLANGEEAVATFNNGDMISVDDLYEEIKDTYALSSLVTMIDKYTLEKTFPDYVETSEEYAESYIEALKENYDSDEDFLADIQSYMGMASIESYQEYIYISYMQSHAMEEYAKTLVTEKEIKNYYKNEAVGDIEVYHILITPEVTDTMTDEEQEEAENKALEKAKSLLKEIKSSDDIKTAFTEAAKENSEDEATAESGGSLGQINKNTLGDSYSELVEAAYSIKDGTVYKDVVKSSLGYHLVYRNTSYEKESLEDMKDDIIEELANQIIDEDDAIAVEALQYYRNELGLEIEDSELKKQYSYYMQNLLSGYSSDDEN